MPIRPFASLPDDARVWVFGSDRPLAADEAARLLGEVDRFLAGWRAHGHPLDAGREWTDERFLTVAVDEAAAGASGCSIDGLYRALGALERAIGAGLLGGGSVFYRDADGAVQRTTRDDFAALARAGTIRRETPVFDTSVESLGAWREEFEVPAERSWAERLLRAGTDRTA